MSKTKAEVRNRVGSDFLGILRLGQPLQSQDDTRISDAYDEVYEQLKKDGLATWASTASVPAAIVPHMVALIAQQCQGTYSLSLPRQALLLQAAGINGENAKSEIRKLASQDFSSKDDPVDF